MARKALTRADLEAFLHERLLAEDEGGHRATPDVWPLSSMMIRLRGTGWSLLYRRDEERVSGVAFPPLWTLRKWGERQEEGASDTRGHAVIFMQTAEWQALFGPDARYWPGHASAGEQLAPAWRHRGFQTWSELYDALVAINDVALTYHVYLEPPLLQLLRERVRLDTPLFGALIRIERLQAQGFATVLSPAEKDQMIEILKRVVSSQSARHEAAQDRRLAEETLRRFEKAERIGSGVTVPPVADTNPEVIRRDLLA